MNNLWNRTDTTFADFYAQYQRGLWVLDPEHQRNVVHNNTWKSGIINSALTFGDIPQVYFHKIDKNRKESLDGKQRCSAIVEFQNDEFVFQPDTEVPTEYQNCIGKLFSEFPVQAREDLENTQLSCKVFTRPMTMEEISRFFLDRQVTKVTTVGEKLNAQMHSRIRHQAMNLLQHPVVSASLHQVKTPGCRKAHIELIVRIMYAHRHHDVSDLDPKPNILTNWFANGEPFSDDELTNICSLLQIVINVLQHVPETWGWKISTKSILLPIYNIIQTYHNDNMNFQTVYNRLTNKDLPPINLDGVNGNHHATINRRDAILQACFP